MRGIVSQADLYSVDEAINLIDGMISESGIEIGKGVAAARVALLRLQTQQRELLTAIAEQAENDDPRDTVEALVDALTQGSTTPEAALDRMKRISRGRPADITRLKNQVTFRFSKAADREVRELGNRIIADILRPWAERVISELTPHAHVVVEHGHSTVHPEGEATSHDYLRAEELTAEMHRIWALTNRLRGRGVLTSLANSADPRWLAFKAPHKIADESKAVREAWWLSFAVVNGGGPTVRDSYQAATAQGLAA